MSTPHALPLLDLSPFAADESSPEAQAFVDELREVVHTVGFLYVTGHGVDPELATRIHDVTRAFFALAGSRPAGDRERQFAAVPRLHALRPRARPTAASTCATRSTSAASCRRPSRLRRASRPGCASAGPNLWPTALPELRDRRDGLDGATRGTSARRCCARWSVALGQPADHFDAAVDPPEVLLKLIRYLTPPTADSADLGDVTAARASAPTATPDSSPSCTRTTSAVCRSSATADSSTCRACPARSWSTSARCSSWSAAATSRPPCTGSSARRRAPSGSRSPTSSTPSSRPRSRRSSCRPQLAAEAPGGESADPSNPILANYGDNSLKVRLRAHPDVAERHHADLLALGTWTA